MDRQAQGVAGLALAFVVGPWLIHRAWGRRPPNAVVALSLGMAVWTLWSAARGA